jgi:murein DD-endopeptidase MepM/ murein hydrolase activator NlpD
MNPAEMAIRVAAAAFLSLSIAIQVTPGAAGPQKTKDELQQIREQASELTERLSSAQERRDQLRAEITQLNQIVSALTAQVEILGEEIAFVRKEVRRAGTQISRLERRLEDRARAAYIDGPASALELVLEADSLNDLSDRIGFLQILQREDSSLAVGIETERASLQRFAARLADYRQEKQVLLAELRPQQDALNAALLEEEALIRQVMADREEAAELASRLQKKLQTQLEAAAAAAESTSPVVDSGGGRPPPSGDGPLFQCPVDPPRSYVDTFGAPRPGGRTHEGNDIFAPYGTPIRAPFDGQAVESSNSLGGLAVNVYSPNGDYVYNAHMSRYAGVSGFVQAGTIIGYVGNSGNAIGTSPHDHFEYHPGGGSAVSPYVYLNEVCGVNGVG